MRGMGLVSMSVNRCGNEGNAVAINDIGRCKPITKKTRRKSSPFHVVAFFVLPALTLYLTFVIYPVMKVFRLSLFRWAGMTKGTEVFVGIGNYAKLLQDEIFWQALINNLLLLAFVVIVSVTLAIFLAYHLATGLKGSGLYRTTWLFPNMLGDVIVATIWLFIFHPTLGMLNHFLSLIGIEIGATAWLGQSSTVLLAISLPMIWKFMGLYIILFLAAIQEIPQSLLDAGKVDGAGRWAEFYHITLPLIRPTIAVAIVFLMWNSFNGVFTYVLLMSKGGPHRASEVIPTYIYQAGFEFHEFGYGAAISVIAFVAIFALASLTVRMLMRRLLEGKKGF